MGLPMEIASVADHSFQTHKECDLTNLRFPAVLVADFPRENFLDLLRSSLSLNLLDKLRILLELPRLSPQQISELYETFEREMAGLEVALKDPYEFEVARKKSSAVLEWPEVVRRWNILSRRPPQAAFDSHHLLTPEALHLLLDAHVIGQSHVTGELAMLVYQQMLAYHVVSESAISLPRVTRPVLLAGFTGTGKTFTIQKVCELTELPFVHINTASMVQEGIIGTSISDIGREILRKAADDVKRAEHAIVFLDEFDKTMSGSFYGAGVVNQLLRVIEGSEITLHPGRWDDTDSKPKVPSLSTRSMLFILGGSFQNLLESKRQSGIGFMDHTVDGPANLSWKDLVRFGFPKELAGRINTILTLNPLSEDDYFAILTQSGSSPLTDYLRLVQGFGDDVTIPEDALREMARQAAETGLGTRALHKIVYGVFKDILYDAPNPIVQTFMITREKVLDVVEGECR